MYFDDAEGQVFRPPSEADSFILRVTVGCSHNRCTYCNMYRGVAFRIRPLPEIMAQIERATVYKNHVRRIFLADGNALVLPTERLLEILAILQERFPKLRRVSCYAGPKDMLRKTPQELEALAAAGLTLFYYGMESGDNEVLQAVNKGVTAAEAIEAGQKAVAAGIKLSVMVILGLAGREGSRRHARETARAISAIRPNMLSALTLMLYRGSELRTQYEAGTFSVISPAETMEELYDMIAQIELPSGSHCIFRSNHISNHIALGGTLPRDKELLLTDIKEAAQELARLKHWDVYNNVER